LASLKSLNRNDVVEVKVMQKPPAGVILVMEAVCVLKGVKPKKKDGEKPGQKIDDYWEPAKGMSDGSIAADVNLKSFVFIWLPS